MEETILSELRGLGLSEKESRVYLAAIKLGSTTMQKIAKVSGVNRATTYVLVEHLMKRGLMSSYTKGKKRYFTVEAPEKLQRLLETERAELKEKEAMINHVMPQLHNLFEATHGGDKPQVRFYEGINGLKNFRDEILKCKEKVTYALYHDQKRRESYDDNELQEFRAKCEKKGIHFKIFYSSPEGPTKSNDRYETVTYHYIPQERYNSPTEYFAFDNKVLISTREDDFVGVLIESKEIALSFKQMLDLYELLPQE